MPVNWNAELDKTLLLTCLEHHNITPKWSEIAPKLGPEFTAEAVRSVFHLISLVLTYGYKPHEP